MSFHKELLDIQTKLDELITAHKGYIDSTVIYINEAPIYLKDHMDVAQASIDEAMTVHDENEGLAVGDCLADVKYSQMQEERV